MNEIKRNTLRLYKRILECTTPVSFYNISKSNIRKLIETTCTGIEFFSALVPSLNSELNNKFNKFLDSSELEKKLIIFQVQNQELYELRNPDDLNRDIIESIVVSLIRLLRFYDIIINKYMLSLEDNDIFAPSNIQKDLVINQINLAIQNVKDSVIRKEEQEKIISDLEETKIEIVKDRPSWKKIIGGIVIAATIISSVADIDDAIKNLNIAYIHIIGKSFQKSVPSVLNPMVPIDFINSNNNICHITV